MFATCVPGLTPLLRKELEALPEVTVQDTGFDGRSDLVLFTAGRSALKQLLRLRLTEDVFVEVGRTLRAEGDRPNWIAGRIWKPERVARALATRGQVTRPLRARTTFRVVVRVLQERSFLRTDLRRHFSAAIGRNQPQWGFADPSELEVWVMEHQAGRLVAGLRASDARMRQHDGRVVERSGALRPTVAAAMVYLAGPSGGLLLDPCCGSGTILAEAQDVDWDVRGIDIDPDAVTVARDNVRSAQVDKGDARSLELADESVAACVSNLPFGQQYQAQGDMDKWLRAVLQEMARVTRPGGRIVLLSPSVPRNLVPPELRLTDRVPVRLLGTKAIIWAYGRR